jgi:hypothetical protein
MTLLSFIDDDLLPERQEPAPNAAARATQCRGEINKEISR